MSSIDHPRYVRELDAGVDLRVLDRSLAEDLLDVPDVGAAHEERRVGVTPDVRMDRPANAGRLRLLGDDLLESRTAGGAGGTVRDEEPSLLAAIPGRMRSRTFGHTMGAILSRD